MVVEYIGGLFYCVGVMVLVLDVFFVVGEMGIWWRGLWVNNLFIKEKVLFVIKDGFKNGELGVFEGCLSFFDVGIEVGFFFIVFGVLLGGN